MICFSGPVLIKWFITLIFWNKSDTNPFPFTHPTAQQLEAFITTTITSYVWTEQNFGMVFSKFALQQCTAELKDHNFKKEYYFRYFNKHSQLTSRFTSIL